MNSCALPPEAGGGIPGYSRTNWQRAATLFLVAACALYFFWRVRDVVVPFLISFFLAALMDPLATRLQRSGWSRGRAVAMIYLTAFLVIVATALWVGPLAINQVESLSRNAESYSDELIQQSDKLYTRYYKQLHPFLKANPLKDRTGPVARAAAGVLDNVKATALGIAGSVIWLIIIPLSLFYFLMDFQSIRARLISLAPPGSQASIARMSAEIVEIFSSYMRSLAIVCVLYGLTAVVLFSLLGLRYGLFLGLAAGVLYAVPYIGPATTTISSAVIALTMNPVTLMNTSITLSPVAYAILVVCVFVTMHVSFDYGITPRLVGGSVGLHPLVNIFALMCGATAFGVWGMLLAVPVAASIQMLLVYFFPRLAEKPPIQAVDGVVPAEMEPALR